MLKVQDFRQTSYYVIDDERYNIQELTCEQIRIHFGTGRSIHIGGTGRDKKYIYRSGCMTDIGDILEADWFALARFIIERDGEQALFEGLVDYAKSCAWLHSRNEREEYALQLHMSRIFDNKDWVGYQEFNKTHRPWVLQGDEKGEAQCECESKLSVSAKEGCSDGQITQVHPQGSHGNAKRTWGASCIQCE